MNEIEAFEWFRNGRIAAAKAIEEIHADDGTENCQQCETPWPCQTLQAVSYGVEPGYWLAGDDLINAADACSSVVSEFEDARGWERVVEDARQLEERLRAAMRTPV